MKAIYVDLPNHRGDKAPARHLSPPNEIFSAWNGLHLIELLDNGVPWIHTPPSITKAIGCSQQMDGKALLLETMHTQLTGFRELRLVPG